MEDYHTLIRELAWATRCPQKVVLGLLRYGHFTIWEGYWLSNRTPYL